MAIAPTAAPKPGKRPTPPPPAAQQAATPTRSNAQAEQPDGSEIAALLDGQAGGRTSSRQSNRQQQRSGQGGPAKRLSAGDEGAIRERLRPCWNIDEASRNKPAVEVRVAAIQPDGTIRPQDVTVVNDGGDPSWGARARRALLNPACQPLPAPQGGWTSESYLFNFDPKDYL